MEISVIIPVYNAEKFVRKAVESALSQSEVSEVLLVEDDSTDNSLEICREIEEQYEKIKLLRHQDGKNHGAGATRNLGIENAGFDYVAFLDADDFYLTDRFKVPKKIFEQNRDIDGVYEAIGIHFYNDHSKEKWFASGGKDLTTVTMQINPSHLFEALIVGHNGYFHLDGLVVKRSLFERCGCFIEHLRLHQDTAMSIQMSACGKLVPGRLNTPVAKRGIHGENRILAEYHRHQTVFLLWQALFHWAYKRNLNNTRLIILFQNYMYSVFRLVRKNATFSHNNFALLREFIFESFRHPYLFFRAGLHFIKKIHTF